MFKVFSISLSLGRAGLQLYSRKMTVSLFFLCFKSNGTNTTVSFSIELYALPRMWKSPWSRPTNGNIAIYSRLGRGRHEKSPPGDIFDQSPGEMS